jgi:hypothetical protein
MTEFDPARHADRLRDLAALQSELLPDPGLLADKIRAEYEDANLCGDGELAERTHREAERMMTHSARMQRLWWLMTEAQRAQDEALSEATAGELRRTILSEFRRSAERGDAR